MKKNISRNPLWPDWYNGKKIDNKEQEVNPHEEHRS